MDPALMRRRSALAVVLACAALACASGPPRPRGTGGLPALDPGLSRLILFRVFDTDANLFHPKLTVDGEPVGELPAGTFLFVDRPPGVREIAVAKQPNASAFGGQAPSKPIAVLLVPGETSYVQFVVNLTPVWIESWLTPTDPIPAQSELTRLTQADSGP
jgi:hypothetical protein